MRRTVRAAFRRSSVIWHHENGSITVEEPSTAISWQTQKVRYRHPYWSSQELLKQTKRIREIGKFMLTTAPFFTAVYSVPWLGFFYAQVSVEIFADGPDQKRFPSLKFIAESNFLYNTKFPNLR